MRQFSWVDLCEQTFVSGNCGNLLKYVEKGRKIRETEYCVERERNMRIRIHQNQNQNQCSPDLTLVYTVTV